MATKQEITVKITNSILSKTPQDQITPEGVAEILSDIMNLIPDNATTLSGNTLTLPDGQSIVIEPDTKAIINSGVITFADGQTADLGSIDTDTFATILNGVITTPDGTQHSYSEEDNFAVFDGSTQITFEDGKILNLAALQTTVSNGLTKDDNNNITLGGTLDEDAIIDLNEKSLVLNREGGVSVISATNGVTHTALSAFLVAIDGFSSQVSLGENRALIQTTESQISLGDLTFFINNNSGGLKLNSTVDVEENLNLFSNLNDKAFRYEKEPTFNNDLDIPSKKYVDDTVASNTGNSSTLNAGEGLTVDSGGNLEIGGNVTSQKITAINPTNSFTGVRKIASFEDLSTQEDITPYNFNVYSSDSNGKSTNFNLSNFGLSIGLYDDNTSKYTDIIASPDSLLYYGAPNYNDADDEQVATIGNVRQALSSSLVYTKTIDFDGDSEGVYTILKSPGVGKKIVILNAQFIDESEEESNAPYHSYKLRATSGTPSDLYSKQFIGGKLETDVSTGATFPENVGLNFIYQNTGGQPIKLSIKVNFRVDDV